MRLVVCAVVIAMLLTLVGGGSGKLKGVEKFRAFSAKLMNSPFHLCKNFGEVYSGSYLIHKARLFDKFTEFNLDNASCEMASTMFMNQHKMIQTVDVLDLSVINLSTYERMLSKYGVNDDKDIIKYIDPMTTSAVSDLKDSQWKSINKTENHQTVVIIPVLLSEVGDGYSRPMYRKRYLQPCFWSFYIHYKHIVAFVYTASDYDYVKHMSGLPFYDVIHIQNLPKPGSLPVASVQQTKILLQSKKWNFDYIFYTESDQVLIMRNPIDNYKIVGKRHDYVVIPHRLSAYPDYILKDKKRKLSQATNNKFTDYSCCLPRQQCEERESWAHIKNSSVEILRIFNLSIPLGNSNFHIEKYRTCTLMPRFNASAGKYCP